MDNIITDVIHIYIKKIKMCVFNILFNVVRMLSFPFTSPLKHIKIKIVDSLHLAVLSLSAFQLLDNPQQRQCS